MYILFNKLIHVVIQMSSQRKITFFVYYIRKITLDSKLLCSHLAVPSTIVNSF